jgi:hypothetical protein
MKKGDRVDVLHEGFEFEATIIGVHDENGTICVKDDAGIQYQYVSPLTEGAIRGFTRKAGAVMKEVSPPPKSK